MKKFLIEIILFLLFVSVSVFFVFSFADGNTDPFYVRFTTPKQSSLILGTSRAAQCIQPKILNEILKRNDIFNYAFTVGNSSYGPDYFESIKKKLNPNTKNGIFIITVDPWSVSERIGTVNNFDDFKDSKLLSNTKFVNLNPNIPYLINNFNRHYINILIKPLKRVMFLHDDGWLEVNVDMNPSEVEKRTTKKIKYYKENVLNNVQYSELRYSYLVKTIKRLKKHGKVFLVRLPAHLEMIKIEKKLMPEFDNLITDLCEENGLSYLNFNNKVTEYEYTDGNHIYKESGLEVTREIAYWIKSQ